MKTMAAGKFKVTCLAVIDEVAAKRESVLITKHGKAVAQVLPVDVAKDEDPLAKYKFPGKIEIVGDITTPLYTDEELEEFFERSVRQANGEDV